MLTDKQPSRPSIATYFRFMEILIPKWNVQTRILDKGGGDVEVADDIIIRGFIYSHHPGHLPRVAFCTRVQN